jgi:hypothetical protein
MGAIFFKFPTFCETAVDSYKKYDLSVELVLNPGSLSRRSDKSSTTPHSATLPMLVELISREDGTCCFLFDCFLRDWTWRSWGVSEYNTILNLPLTFFQNLKFSQSSFFSDKIIQNHWNFRKMNLKKFKST